MDAPTPTRPRPFPSESSVCGESVRVEQHTFLQKLSILVLQKTQERFARRKLLTSSFLECFRKPNGNFCVFFIHLFISFHFMMQHIFSEMLMANIFENQVAFNVGSTMTRYLKRIEAGRKIISTGMTECVCKINTVPVLFRKTKGA